MKNIWKSQNNWEWLSWILGREGANAKTLEIFYKVGGPINAYVCIIDMGHDPTHWQDSGSFPLSSVLTSDVKITMEERGQ